MSDEHHCHAHHHAHAEHPALEKARGLIATIRSQTGISGDIILTGLSILNMAKNDIEPQSDAGRRWFKDILVRILPELADCAQIKHVQVHGIGGWRAEVNLPHCHEHRNLAEITELIEKSGLMPDARTRAIKCFTILAECEAAVHGLSINDIHFHEVGALDSILDICCSCELFELLQIQHLICSPLPLADGAITCAHGIIPAPAPATLRLLKDMPVRPFQGVSNAGELLTPTGLALLKAFDCAFGPWPAFTLKCAEIIYGQKVFEDTANGVIFALGESK